MANTNEMKILLTGDAGSAMAAVDALGDKLKEFGSKIAGAAIGFGGLAEVGSWAAEKIGEGIRDLVNIIPEAIHSTGELTESYKALHITAGMTVQDFNAYSAAIQLAGGKVEDLSSLVMGMERGIKQHSDNLVANGVAADNAALSHMTLGEYISRVVDIMQSYGDASDRDQLLMAAFGRGGIAFAAQLVEVNKNMKEGLELSQKYITLTDEAVRKQTQLTEAKGRLAQIEKVTQAEISEHTIDADIAITNFQTSLMQARYAQHQLVQALADGVVQQEGYYKAVLGNDNHYHAEFVENRSAEQEALDRLIKKWGDYADETKNSMDAGTHTGFKVGDQLPTRTYESQKDEDARAAAARKAAADAKRKEKEDDEVLNQLVERGASLRMEALRSEKEFTLEQEKEKALAIAAQERDETLARISNDVAKSPTIANQMAAQQAFNEANSVFRIKEMNAEHTFNVAVTEDKLKMYAQIMVLEKGSLGDRLEVTRQHINKMIELNDKLPENMRVTNAVIQVAQEHMEAKDLEDQTKIDAEKLKEALKHKAEMQGALTPDETKAAISSYAYGDAAQKAAAAQVSIEMHLDQGAADGAIAGLQKFSAQADNIYTQMSKFAQDMANTLTSSLSKAFMDIVTKGTSFGNAMKAVWKGLSQAVIQALMQMAARQLVNFGIDQVIAAWKAAHTTTEIAQSTAKQSAAEVQLAKENAATEASMAADNAKTAALAAQVPAIAAQEAAIVSQTTAMDTATVSAFDLAVAETWGAYAYIPFGGEALSEAQISAMFASATAAQATAMGMVVAHATGGLIDKPTLALMGEAGREVVAPETDFQDWGNAQQNLGYNLAAHQNQVATLQAQAGSYGAAGLAANGGKAPDMRPIQVTGNIFADTLNGQRMLAQMVNGSNQGIGRYNG